MVGRVRYCLARWLGCWIAWSIRVEWPGAGVVAKELVSEWAGPHEDPGVGHLVAPPAPGFEAVVSSAQGCEVVGARGAAAAGMLAVVRDQVVEVAAPRVATAPREHARAVPCDDMVADSDGRGVAVRLEALVQVDDGLDDDAHVGASAPGPELVCGEDPVAGLFDVPAQTLAPAREVGAEDRVGGQVGVQHDLGHGLRRRGLAAFAIRSLVVEPERELVAGQVTPRGGPASAEGVGGSEVGEPDGAVGDRLGES